MSSHAGQRATKSQKKQHHEHHDLSHVLDDLSMRFIVNLPAEEFESFERLFFAIESAHWFYDDFYREKDPTLPRLPLKQFAARIFEHTALLSDYRDDVDRLLSQFQSYKQEVPTCGAAMLNPAMDKVLLVRGWGRDARWSFPKGKLAKDESELACAIREVEEETGFDMTPLVSDSTFYIDSYTSGRCSRIFCVRDVPEHTLFVTQTRKEISAIDWVDIAALPDNPKMARQQSKAAPRDGPHSEKPRMLFAQQSLVPFTKRLRSWIKRQRKIAPLHGPHVRSPPAQPGASLPPVSPQLYADVVRTSPPLMSPPPVTQLPFQPPPGALSVEDLEATFAQQPPPPPAAALPTSLPAPQPGAAETDASGAPRRRNARKQKDSATKPQGGRKSRRDLSGAEAERNRTTFGESTDMSNVDRDVLFCQYVMDTDQRMEAQGPSDEFWPVPLITSKDFTEEQRRAVERARLDRLQKGADCKLGGAAGKPVPIPAQISDAGAGGKARRVTSERTRLEVPRKSTPTAIDGFAFDRAAIMSSMLQKDAP